MILLFSSASVNAQGDANATAEANSYFEGATAQLASLSGYDLILHIEESSLYEDRIVPTLTADYRIRLNKAGDDYFVAEYRKYTALEDTILGNLEKGILAASTWRLQGRSLSQKTGRYAPTVTTHKSFSDGMRSGKVPCIWRIGQDQFIQTTLANHTSESTLKRIFAHTDQLSVTPGKRKDDERVLQIVADVSAGCKERYTWLFSEAELLPLEFRISQDCGVIFSDRKPIYHQQLTWEDHELFGTVPVSLHSTSMILVRIMENGKEKQTVSESYIDASLQWRPHSIEEDAAFSKESYTIAEIEEMVRPQGTPSEDAPKALP